MSEYANMSFDKANGILNNHESTREDRFEARLSFELTVATSLCNRCKRREICFMNHKAEKDEPIVSCRFYEYKRRTTEEIQAQYNK